MSLDPRVTELHKRAAARPDVIPLAGGLPADELLPSAALSAVVAKSALHRDALQYGWPEGLAAVRSWIASRLVARGACVDTTPRRAGTSVPEGDRQFRLIRVHHEHREELGRLRRAGIGADAVAVTRQLGEALSGLVGRHRSVVDLTADRPLKHGRVDEGGFGVRVARRVAARPVFDEHTLDALAGNVRQLVLVDEGHLRVLRLRRIGEDAAERQGGDKQRAEDAFHGALFFGRGIQDQALARERRSHSSKPMPPRRASPNGTSERSSTRPPKYRASGSLTTSRGSPTAFR